MENDVLSLISQRNPGFSKGQRKIAKYILTNYDKAAFMTASKLGKAAAVSESTVVRFAADLGYDGYPEMKRALQELIKNRLTTVQRIEVSKEIMERGHIIDTVLASDVEKIRLTLDEIDRDSFERAVNKIVGARSIYVVGLRSSGYLAGFFGFYLNFLFNDVRVVCDSAASAIFEQIQHINGDDILIALSFPRYSRRTITAMQFARNMGATVIGITDTENSLVARNADIKLYAHSDMLSFLDSLVAPLSLINALIVAAADASGSDLEDKFTRLEKMWAEYEVYEKHN